MTVFQHLRRRLLMQAGLLPAGSRSSNLKHLYQSEWNPRFEQLCRNRLVMGWYRGYGSLSEPSPTDRLQRIRTELREYQRTGNQECLVDIANFAMAEFSAPQHPRAHWLARDDH